MDNQNDTQKKQDDSLLSDSPKQKLFTQEELDEIIKARLKRAEKNIPSKEELEEFRRWREEYESIEALRQKAELAHKKLTGYERKDKILKKGVPERLCDFFLFEAEKAMSDSTDFDKALDKVISQNSDLLSMQDSWGMRQGSAKRQPSGVEIAFLKRNPNLKL
jgi:hypothetical protein